MCGICVCIMRVRIYAILKHSSVSVCVSIYICSQFRAIVGRDVHDVPCEATVHRLAARVLTLP